MEDAMNRQETHQTRTSLVEARAMEFSSQLENFFKTSDHSFGRLRAVFEQNFPSSSPIESIIYLYPSKPSLNRLLDQAAEILTENDVNLLTNPFCYHHQQWPVEKKRSNLLHHSILKNHEHIFRLLLKVGFDSNAPSTDGKTPLSMAVVASHMDSAKRLDYIELLLAYGGNALRRDNNNASPFKRLCGLDSNYPRVYTFFRDYLLSVYPDQSRYEFDNGLKNALFNWRGCLPIVIDLLEHGASLKALQNTDAFIHFLSQIASIMFVEHRSIASIDTLFVCMEKLLSYNSPCVNYPLFIETFFEEIYLPAVCFESNIDPINRPSMSIVKSFLYLCSYYGYLKKTNIDRLRTVHLPSIMTQSIQNSLVNRTILRASRQLVVDNLSQYLDELAGKFHQNPVPLKLLCARQIRRSMVKLNEENIEQLTIARHIKRLLWLPTSIN